MSARGENDLEDVVFGLYRLNMKLTEPRPGSNSIRLMDPVSVSRVEVYLSAGLRQLKPSLDEAGEDHDGLNSRE